MPAGNIFQSTDSGANWNLIASMPTINGSSEYCCATLYELPQHVGALGAGTLVMFWSDETDPCCSQRLVQIWTDNWLPPRQ